MSNLIPTPRTNKNGVTVIRHMKPEDNSASTGMRLPAPQLMNADHKEALVERAAMVIGNEVRIDGPDADDLKAISEYLRAYSFDDLSMMIDLEGTPDTSRLWLIHDNLEQGVEPALIRDYLRLAPLMEERGIEEMIMWDYVRGFQQYEGLAPIDEHGGYPDERLEQCAQITDIILAMIEVPLSDDDLSYTDDKDEWTPFIMNEKLRSLLFTSDYDRTAVFGLITERGLFNADDITAILDHKINPALAEGAI